MSITNEEKAQYVKAIDAIWEGSLHSNSISNINSNVVRFVDMALTEISNCSKPFAAINALFSMFYSPPTTWGTLLLNAAQSGADVTSWIAALRGNAQYKGCVVTTAAGRRSQVQMALMGI